MADPITILALSGSTRSGSYNTMLLKTVRAMAPQGMAIDIVGLKGLPLYDGDEEEAQGVPAGVVTLAERVRAASGVIIATPEYNFSIPGVLKNATDWVSRVKNQPFKDKRTGIMGASGGPIGTARAQYHLRQNLQGLEAQVMPRPEIFVGLAPTKFAATGELTDVPTREVITAWLKAFEAWVRRG